MFNMVSHVIFESVRKNNPFIQKLKEVIDWERISNVVISQYAPKKTNAGRPAFDIKLMLKIIILQECYNLSDDTMESRINNDISFKYFLDLDMLDHSPDAKTIWLFKEKLRKHKIEQILFDEFHKFLSDNNIRLNKGTTVDASFTKVPVQRNTKEENDQIKSGKVPEEFEKNPNKLRQKDTDARWTKKNNKSYYGYKNHIAIDTISSFIETYCVSSAEVHDSVVFKKLFPDGKGRVYGDSAYRSEAISAFLRKHKCQNFIHNKAYRNKPLSEVQIQSNKRKSKTRARVEHVFGRMRVQMNRGLELRCIGIERVRFRVGIRNTVYNMLNFITLMAN